MTRWARLWSDMPTDPKWRVIAKRSGRSISEVMAAFNFMLANACERSERDDERGELHNWSDEDVAAALDLEAADIAAIRDAMQGKVLDGDKLIGWEKRQPKREDGSSERAKQWRERKRTQANAEKRSDPDPDSEGYNSIPSTELEPARVKKSEIDKLVRIGIGSARHGAVSPEAKRAVCRTLGIETADPIEEVFERVRGDRPARTSIDRWFGDMAGTIWKNHPEIHAACRPLSGPDPPPVVSAKPSSSLATSKLVKASRHAN